jgi:hypothetical protein
MKPPPSVSHSEIRVQQSAIAERLTLPLKLGLRRTSGHVAGAGAGSSIDFQDHRPYVPGDDPRHIDWQAYARSGHYTMKLYREEVRPLVDIVLDASPSMFLGETKARRTWELAWFCLESALRSGATIRLFSIDGVRLAAHDASVAWETVETVSSEKNNHPPDLSRIPWRNGSLRVLISDLLFPSAPEPIIHRLLSSCGRGLIFAPSCMAESAPDWLGNTELIDCESPARRDLRFHSDDLAGYRSAYAGHFQLWRLESRRHGISLAQVAAEPAFTDALGREAIREGAVEFV